MAERSKQQAVNFRLRWIDVVIGIGIICIPLWYLIAAPQVLRISKHFSYSADVISVDNPYDELAGEFKGEQYSRTVFSYDVVGSRGNQLLIRNTFDVQTLEGKQVYKAEPVYGIDAVTGAHIPGMGDRDRTGYLFAPRDVRKQQAFTYWHPSSNIPATMRFVAEERLYGLTVYKYGTDYGGPIDQTEVLGFVPEVGETRGIKLVSTNYLWIEPVTGYLVKQEDFSTDYYYYDLRTGERIGPYNQFLNRYAEESVKQQVTTAKQLKWKAYVVRFGMPLLLLFIVLVLCIIRFGLFMHVRQFMRRNYLSILFLLILLLATYASYIFTSQTIQANMQEELESQARDVRERIERRLGIYTSALIGGRAFFDASDEVTRDEWRQYVKTLDLENRFPGIVGLGFTRIVTPEERDDFVASVRAEGFPTFTLWPERIDSVYSSVLYFEPFTELNQRALGFDMLSEETRRRAMYRARDTGQPSVSGRIALVTEEAYEVQQPGFIAYMPVFAKGMPTTTDSERQQALIGFVYAPFRMQDLLEGIVGSRHFDLDFHIYDGLKASERSKMYDRAGQNSHNTREYSDILYNKIETIYIADHPWTIEYINAPEYRGSVTDRFLPWIVLYGGLVLSLLLARLVQSQALSRHKAMAYAKKLNVELEKNRASLERKNTDLERTKKAILNVLEDVQSEKKKLAELTDRFKLATDSAKIGVWQWDVVQNTLTWDDQMFALYGVARKDFSGAYDAWQQGLHPDDRAMGDAAIQAALQGTKDFNLTFRVVWPDTSVHYIRAFGYVERDAKGKPLRMIGVNWDITREAEVDRAKSEFVSLASHQLRTPLSAINWYSEMLMDGDAGKITDKQREYLQEIYAGNKRMIDLVNALLNVSRIDLGTFAIEPERASITEIADEVLNELKPQILQKKQRIKKEIQSVPKIDLDRQLTRIIILNLLSNAVKYTPEGGRVSFRIAPVKNARTKALDWIEIVVSDTGYGIPKAQQGRIFGKLFRADNVRQKELEGTGLGLYIVKAIMDEVKGSISFVSEENKGTTFTVRIPGIGMQKKSGSKNLNPG